MLKVPGREGKTINL
ncbi:unnamed protein product [Fusarium fujikuroi]|uniref:Uncharacterized protein n=1 Tax=Fusarium fujikuroi TaxID=5127 RepID=A0A9Q9RRY4_FUSFU|nr:unnamed protein product [Fusarium fujikuroi]